MLASFGFDDLDLARRLQEEYDKEAAAQLAAESNSELSRSSGGGSSTDKYNASHSQHSSSSVDMGISPVDPSLEVTDPNPDIRELFLQFNDQFFWGKLLGIEVKWSPRMTLCAGLCVYEGHGGLCSVRLSLPLLKLRPRKDLVETLLHEMIHAFLFVTDHEKDHDDHGPNFKKHMNRINKETGADISIYHTFHDEVASYQQHWWKCDGPCQKRPPYYGMVKRAMNRAPSLRDPWFGEHQATCGGTFLKVKEPEGYGQKKGKAKVEKNDKLQSGTSDLRAFVGKGVTLGGSSTFGKSVPTSSLKGANGTGNRDNGKEKGLAVITNGVLTHKKTSGVLDKKHGSLKQPPEKSSSPLFSSIASTSGTTGNKSTSSSTKFNNGSNGGISQSQSSGKIQRPSIGSPGASSRKPVVKGKGKFNDNITLLELFKRRQAREKARQNGSEQEPIVLDAQVKKEPDSASEQNSCIKEKETVKIKVEKERNLKDDDDDCVVDLTLPDEDDFRCESPKTATPDRLSDIQAKPKVKVNKHWKNIFPSLSDKKRRDKLKGSIKGKFPRNFVSVCEGGHYDDVSVKSKHKRPKGEKKKHKYIFDELDSNDDLWNEEESSVSTRKPNDPNLSSQSNASDDDHSGPGTDRSRSHNNSTPGDQDCQRSPIPVKTIDQSNPTRSDGGSVPSTSGLNGYRLGKGKTGLSFLAQVRKKIRDEMRQSNGSSRSNVECSVSSESESRASVKRHSDVAFEDENIDDLNPRAKKHSVGGIEEFVAEEEVVRRGDNQGSAARMVTCPACAQLVLESNINEHLDRCLV
ncbi:hypothetical protein EGW08_001654 [Elysia chlorotica]|uniref:Protein with SprT-like domain at the N terminus n=1 Tax=Elysia chlorotica TaxID=188477 RepID=A0A3S1BSM5_ELYCH|nr:hypothetical protein EGW08_001654 [Elysia chlorotica]